MTNTEFIFLAPNQCLHIGKATRELLGSVIAISEANCLMHCLVTVIQVVGGMSTALVTMKNSIVDKLFERSYSIR